MQSIAQIRCGTRSFFPGIAVLVASLWLPVIWTAALAQPSATPDDPEVMTEDQPADDTIPFDGPYDFSLPSPAETAGKVNPAKFAIDPKSGWGAKAGLDYRAPASPTAAFRPDRILPGAPQDQATGIAWANVTAPGLTTAWGWDKAAFDARIDPEQDGSLGMTLSRSLPVGSDLAVTLQNGTTVSQTLARGAPTAEPGLIPVPVAPGPRGPEQTYATSQSMRFSILPLDTTLSVGAAFSSTDDKWVRSLSAEQKLFGGPVSVTGTVSESAGGEFSKSVKAGFKHNW